MPAYLSARRLSAFPSVVDVRSITTRDAGLTPGVCSRGNDLATTLPARDRGMLAAEDLLAFAGFFD